MALKIKIGKIGVLDMLKFSKMPDVREAAIQATPANPLPKAYASNAKAALYHPVKQEVVVADIVQNGADAKTIVLKSVDGKALGSAPYAAWTPAGGELGTITVSGTFMRKGKSTTGTDIFISRDMGKTWTTVSHPIPYNSSVDHCGYSNSMMFSSDGAIMYAVNNPQKKDGSKGNIVFARADTTLYLK